jgi:hypothetical protein
MGTGGTALTIKNNTRYTVKNLRFTDGGTGALGTYLTSLAVGSNHGPGTFENCFWTGFTTDVQIGDTSNQAASEILFIQCEVDSATTGVLVQGPASGTSFTTNIRFIGIQAVGCTTVIKVAGDDEGTQIKLSVWGFSFSENTLEFDFQVPGIYRITDGYAEHGTSGQLVKSGSATATANVAYMTKLSFESVITNYTDSPSDFVCLFYQPGSYAMRECTLSTGGIELGGFDGGGGARKATLKLEGCTIVKASDHIAYKASSNTIWNVRVEGCGYANVEAVNMLEDRHYIINTSGTELTLAKYGAWSESAGGAALTATLGLRVVATADLPAAAAAMDGSVIIENTGANSCNLVVYDGGERFKVALTES